MIQNLGSIIIAGELAIIIVLLLVGELKQDNSSNNDNGYSNGNGNNDNSPKNYKKYIEWHN